MHGMNLATLKVFYSQCGYLSCTMVNVGLTPSLNIRSVHVYGVDRTYS